MKIDEIEITLQENEVALLEELNLLQSQIKDVDPKMLNEQMFDAIKNESIKSIAVALNVSYLLDGKNDLASNVQSLKERRENYNRDKIAGADFNKQIKEMAAGAGKDKKTGARERYIDCYTGEELIGGDSDNGKYDYEHPISAKELSTDRLIGIFLSEKEISSFANSESNLNVTHQSINRAKGDMTWKEWCVFLNKPSKDPTKTNAEHYNIDPIRSQDTYNKAQKAYYTTIGKSIGSSVGVKIGKNALKTSIFQFVKIIVIESIDELKKECIDPLTTRMKRIISKVVSRVHELWDTFKESAIGNLISMIIDTMLNFLLTTTKRIFNIIKQLITPIFKAMKEICSPASEKPFPERLLTASNIIGVALVGVLGIALDELINKSLMTVPVFAPFANYISPVLSTLIVGIASVLVLQFFDRFKSTIEFRKLSNKKNEIEYKLGCLKMESATVSDIRVTENIACSISIFKGVCGIASSCQKDIQDTCSNIIDRNFNSNEQLEETGSNLNDIDNMLRLI